MIFLVNYAKSQTNIHARMMTSIWEKSTISVIFVAFFDSVLFALHWLIFPHDAFYMTYYLQYFNLPKIIKIGLYFVYFILFIWVVLKTQLTFCFFSNFTVELLIQSIPILKNEFRIGLVESKYQPISKFRGLSNLPIEYRAGELVMKIVLDLMGILLMIGYGVVLCGAILCNSTLN